MASLTNSYIRSAKPGRHSAGPGGYGLCLMIRPTKCGVTTYRWQQRLEIDGKRTWRALGRWPDMSPAQARDEAARNWLGLKDGNAVAPVRVKVPTFREIAEGRIAAKQIAEATRADWRASFANHLYPRIGSMRADEIETRHLLGVFEALSDSPGAAGKLLSRVPSIFDYAVAKGYRQDNPAGPALKAALPKQRKRTKHHEALPHAEVSSALNKADAVGNGAAAALRFVALTVARSDEARLMDWSEVEGDVWTIPAERTKTRREHRVPLSKQALTVLDQVQGLGVGLVFQSKGKALANNAMSRLMTRVAGKATVHGLRSSFRDWCRDQGVDRELAEACLAHVVGGVEGAYARSDLLGRRRKLMDAWGEYCSEPDAVRAAFGAA